jgi:small subunit ribosomal protein S16
MLVIRLFRVGKKNQPSFKVVVTDKRRPSRGGRFVEEVGFYNPLTKQTNLKAERIKYWISVGAKPLATVFNMLVKEGIIEGRKIPVHKKSKNKENKAAAPPAAPVASASVPERPVQEPKTEPVEVDSAKEAIPTKEGLSSEVLAKEGESKTEPSRAEETEPKN